MAKTSEGNHIAHEQIGGASDRILTQEDPIGFAGGLNLYAYAGNNPATFTDAFGLSPEGDEATADPCGRLRTARLKEECRQRLREYQDAGDASADAFDSKLAQLGKCMLAGVELTARAGVDLGLLYSYGSGLSLGARGLVLAAEGQAVSTGVIHTRTLVSAGRTGAAELASGRALMATGAVSVGAAASAAPSGLSMLPRNAYDFLGGGGMSPCK